MLKRIVTSVFIAAGMFSALPAAAQSVCPGLTIQPGKQIIPTNLACEIAASTGASGVQSTLKDVPATIASQLGQLPMVTAVSGSGIILNKSLGVFTADDSSLGTILTQRGETIGRHKWMLGFTYQHYEFGAIDGVPLDNFSTVQQIGNPPVYSAAVTDIRLGIDQYTAVGSFGLTNRVDLNVLVPFSRVSLDTGAHSLARYVTANGAVTLASTSDVGAYNGIAGGIGDVTVDVKANVIKGEFSSVALGSEVRFPSGDASNYLGSGAYGVKPYFIFSRSGRFTPNVNLGYQWNGDSILSVPSSFFYSGGTDFRLTRKVTLVGEFVGQCVINGYRIALVDPASVPTLEPVAPLLAPNTKTILPYRATYAMDNLGGGIKWRPTKHLIVSGNVLFKLDDAGLRAKVIPLAGAAYKF